jgi:hypothetical protein
MAIHIFGVSQEEGKHLQARSGGYRALSTCLPAAPVTSTAGISREALSFMFDITDASSDLKTSLTYS